jgi:hypothetical protein
MRYKIRYPGDISPYSWDKAAWLFIEAITRVVITKGEQVGREVCAQGMDTNVR